MNPWRRALFALVGLLSFSLAGLASAEELLVSAAASLTEAFREIGTDFERIRPGVKLQLNFAATGQLLQQIEQGAPVDVFASADEESMSRGEAKQLIVTASRRDFATNRLVLVQPKAAAALDGIAALLRPAVQRIAIGNPASVPVGRYARDALQALGLWQAVQPKLIQAATVRQVLDYVARGEVDAGFVYATDLTVAADKVKTVATIPTPFPVRYPLAVVAASKHPAVATDFVGYLCSPAARTVLLRHGFGAP